MEIAQIKGDTVLLLYHPSDLGADVGQQFTLLELPNRINGLVVQVISNDSLEYPGLQQEMIQRILESRFGSAESPVDRELGMGEIKSLKYAVSKIRKRITEGAWMPWDGWIPTRNVDIVRIGPSDLISNVLPTPEAYSALEGFTKFDGVPIAFGGPALNMVNVIAGVKGSGKSHLAKHLVLALASKKVPCVVFDINGEYVDLPTVTPLKWGGNFVPSLAEIGSDLLESVIEEIYPLPETSKNALTARLPEIFADRRRRCETNNVPFWIDIEILRQADWRAHDTVTGAIRNRLSVISSKGLFASTPPAAGTPAQNLTSLYDAACCGTPIVFDMREQTPGMQRALVKAANKTLEEICLSETRANTKRYPFVFFEEAHFYINETAIMNIITRGRHIGMASVFVTNTPQKLPDTVFRQLDNLFLLALTHKDDIRNVSKNSFTDEDTVESFATRMPKHHALIMGNVTNRYPLIVSVDPLPADVPPTGVTRSTWDRFRPTEETPPSLPAEGSSPAPAT